MNEIQLVRSCLNGKANAQRELYNLFAASMYGVCYRYTKSAADAEDVLQEAFVKVFTKLHQYKNDGALGAWIRKIMVTTALNYLKKNKRYSNELSFDETTLHPVSADNPEVLLEAKEIADLIRQLPTGCQTIFNLHAAEGFTHVEIGQMLGIHEGTSRSQYARARSIITGWMGKRNDTIKTQRYAGK